MKKKPSRSCRGSSVLVAVAVVEKDEIKMKMRRVYLPHYLHFHHINFESAEAERQNNKLK